MIDFINKYSVTVEKRDSLNCVTKALAPSKLINKKQFSRKKLTENNKKFLKLIGLK